MPLHQQDSDYYNHPNQWYRCNSSCTNQNLAMLACFAFLRNNCMDDETPAGFGSTPEDAINSLHYSLIFYYGVGLCRTSDNRYWFTDRKRRKWEGVTVTNNGVYKAFIDRSRHYH
jgi:hypothetical protein